jgi:hypothetical protein
MTFPFAPNHISAKLRLLLLVSAFFTHAAISQQSRTINFTIDTSNVNQHETIYTEHMFMNVGRILVSATTHPRYVAPTLALQHRQSGVSGKSYLGGIVLAGGSHLGGIIIAALITTIGTIIVAIISRSGKK